MKQGFSLVELSIVLAILGLIAGGIIAAQSYIRQAELRNVSLEYNRWITASNNFKAKYGMLPGDLDTAGNYWGLLNADPATCTTTPTTLANTPQTCNGNGDDLINNGTGYDERFRFWQQLANAGMIEGLYTGVTGAAGALNPIAGENTPITKLSGGATWNIYYGTGSGFTLNNANIMQLGLTSATGGARAAYFTALEAYTIDNKMDDGFPGKGFVTTYPFGSNCTTAASATDYAATYKTSASTADAASCAFVMNTNLQ